MPAATPAILLVTQYYRPELVGSGPYCGDLAEWLQTTGAPVTVVAGLPHYPGHAVFPAYRSNPPRRERLSGIEVLRLRHWIPRRSAAALRILSEAHFLLAGLWALVRGRVPRRPVVVSLCPSILTVALGAAARRGGRHIAIVHDIQSGLARGLGMVGSGVLVAAMRWCERTVLNRTDLVVVLDRAMRDELRLNGVVVPIEVMPIWVDTERLLAAPSARRTAPVLLYSGNFGRKQGLHQIVALAARLQRERPDVAIVLRGDGGTRDALCASIVAAGLTNVRLAGLLPAERLGDGLAEGDIHLVPQDPDAAAFAVPSKVFNIMAAGRPFVATALRGSPLWRMMEESSAFLCAPPNDARALAEAVLRLVDDPARCAELGANGRRFVEQHCAKPLVLGRFAVLTRMLAAPPPPRHTLVFEPDSEGHPYEWLCHLIDFICHAASAQTVSFIVAPALYRELAARIDDAQTDRVRILPLSLLAARLCTHRRLVISGFARWWWMRRYLARTGAQAGQFLSLDLLSLPLALGLGAGNGRRIGGILFRPSVHYRLLGAYHPRAREWLRDLRKAALYRLMLLNRALGVVLTLDPFFPRHAARFYRAGSKVRAVPDPVHPAVPLVDSDRALADAVPPGRVAFLLFGHLTERKGTLALLESLFLVPEGTASRVAVVLAGKLDPAIAGRVAALRARLAALQPDLVLEIVDRRLSTGEIEALVARADVVLAPYQRFVGSSGVLLWAARAGKPLLTQDFGMIGPLVRNYRLGLAIDVDQPEALAAGIVRFVHEGPHRFIDPQRARAFVARNTPDRFAELVFASVAEG
ncbi:MAG: glycosyltransferase [Alphaproteobacteria bacterium]|nr:glycosyltransferase [Alphaproteobacteria bacterium]